jgi:tetratricopeptide (TPR) repeat protein
MGTPRESEKALRYIEQLDDARCTGRWKDIPELTRKVAKHAPHRQCLILTARSEAQIAAYTTQRPSTAASTASTGLSKLIPELLTAIDDEGDHVQDAFQATICLGWLHFELGEPGLAVARFPKDFAAVASRMSSNEDFGNWTLVCLVKGAYLKGSSQERTATVEEALQTYRSILPWLTSLKGASTIPQFKMWTERLMVRLCLLADQSAETGELVEPEEALQIYRFWAKSWEYIGNSGSGGQSAARFRRLSWKAYYDTLSIILRRRLPYKSEVSTIQSQDFAAKEKGPMETGSTLRFQQRAELKRVETLYESILLKETDFPKANESNQEIEAWTESVMENWRVLCGPTWTDRDLGEGGKEAVARGVLDILYRAATKTFHSTQVLRHLFIVHASLAEFDLAFKAYDTYVEIITRGKDRTEKSGEQDVGIDDDSTVLRTSAEAVRLLCRFGSRAQAEKALDIGEHIEKWLEQTYHIKSATEEGAKTSLSMGIAPKALAAAYSAVGISLAHWARFTYKAEARTSIQNKAVQYLRKALEDKYRDPHNIETLYALGLLLAEMRDIPGATKVVKVALSSATRHKSSISADGVMSGGSPTEFGRERKLIPLWHLLSLLLTARAEYSGAEKSCENAFEQFGDPAILFGQGDEGQPFRSEHLNQLSVDDGGQSGLVDHMEFYEKHGIVQIKMTQLALIEITEGPTTAVDLSDELLGLYHRLFGDPAHDKPKVQTPAVAPPKSSVGTIRHRHSIFRSKSSRRSQAQENTPRAGSVATVTTVASSRPSTVATHTTAAPTIHVTDENGADRETRGRFGHHKRHDGHTPKRSGSKLQKRSSASLRRKSEMDAEKPPNMPGLPDRTTNGTSPQASSVREKSPRRPSVSNSMRKSIENHDRPLRPVAHNMSHAPPPQAHAKQPPKQDVRLPTAFPSADYIAQDPRFSTIQERRQKISLLVSIWTFISRLYIGAEMYEDASAAAGEALKLVETFELEVSQESSSSRAFADRGWGGGKSVEELWADAYAARGEILLAQSLKHEARADFEQALQHFPDHPEAIVGLSNVLLDIYCKVIPFEANQDPLQPAVSSRPPSPPSVPVVSDHSHLKAHNGSKEHRKSHHTPSAENNISPPELTRIVARDRAFMLLSSLTKLGSGWDYSEAWYALARAYEESGQIEKTKEVLWWCVELEDSHPVRSWKSVGLGGFAL